MADITGNQTPNNNNGNSPKIPNAPGNLPFGSDKTLLSHTMSEDVMKAKGDPAAMAKEEASKKPFSERIPPIPMPGGQGAVASGGMDAYREAITESSASGEEQPFVFGGRSENDSAPEAQPKQDFQIYIPPKQSSLRASTIVLASVLVLLIAGGGFGYWYFFMKQPAPETTPITTATTTPPATTPTPLPQPVVTPTPPPPPPPPPPAPEPATSTSELISPEATSTSEIVPPEATSTPPVQEPAPTPEPTPTQTPEPQPIAEPETPASVLSLDQTVTVTISGMDKTVLTDALAAANASIIAPKATVTYLIELSSDTEKRFLSVDEIGSLLGFTVPQTLSSSFSQFNLIGYKDADTFRYGFVGALSVSEDNVQSAALSWENTAVDDLAGLYIQKTPVHSASISFSGNTYLDFYKRYVNMPTSDISLDWAVSPKYFVVATSKNMIYAILDETGYQATSTPPAVAK